MRRESDTGIFHILDIQVVAIVTFSAVHIVQLHVDGGELVTRITQDRKVSLNLLMLEDDEGLTQGFLLVLGVQGKCEGAGVHEVLPKLLLAGVDRVRVDHEPVLHEVPHVHRGEHRLLVPAAAPPLGPHMTRGRPGPGVHQPEDLIHSDHQVTPGHARHPWWQVMILGSTRHNVT